MSIIEDEGFVVDIHRKYVMGLGLRAVSTWKVRALKIWHHSAYCPHGERAGAKSRAVTVWVNSNRGMSPSTHPHCHSLLAHILSVATVRPVKTTHSKYMTTCWLLSHLLVSAASNKAAVIMAPAGCPDDLTVKMTGLAQTGTHLELGCVCACMWVAWLPGKAGSSPASRQENMYIVIGDLAYLYI